ncbi:MAG: DUF2207 domain-containing protein, partial [Eubacterium sp.]|nr:DUF2207 domain-containing protein [Eubacterium sp.]
MKKRSISAILMAFVVCCLFCGSVSAQEYFTTSSYDVEMTVTEDHAYHITETIAVNFTSPRHGLYRYIPYQGSFYREIDGQGIAAGYRAHLYDIDVPNFNFDTDNEDGTTVIQIGDADTYVEGPVTYTIEYIWNPGDDKIDSFDDVYYNIIPHNWNTAIDSASFTIHMPKDFDASTLEFLTGEYGSVDTGKVSYTVDGNTIYATVNGALAQGEGITVNLRLPQGYFSEIPTGNYWKVLMVGAAVICVIAAALLWTKFGRDDKPLEPVTFYPPDNLTPAQIGTIIDGKTDVPEVLSMIIWLADQGYLAIEQTDKSHFTFKKLREPSNELPDFAKTVFSGLFPNNRKSSDIDDLEDFHQDIMVAMDQIIGFFKIPENTLFTDLSLKVQGLLCLLTAIPMIFLGAAFAYYYNGYFSPLFSLICALLGIIPAGLFILLFRNAALRQGTTKGDFIFKMIILSFLLLLIFGSALILSTGLLSPVFPLLCFIASGITSAFAAFSGKRTPTGNRWLGETLGFKHFIQTAELDRIKVLVDENPSYFYHILPYAYVLGVTNRWAKHFESLAVEPPTWYHTYDGYSTFNSIYFTHALMHSMNNIQTTIS